MRGGWWALLFLLILNLNAGLAAQPSCEELLLAHAEKLSPGFQPWSALAVPESSQLFLLVRQSLKAPWSWQEARRFGLPLEGVERSLPVDFIVGRGESLYGVLIGSSQQILALKAEQGPDFILLDPPPQFLFASTPALSPILLDRNRPTPDILAELERTTLPTVLIDVESNDLFMQVPATREDVQALQEEADIVRSLFEKTVYLKYGATLRWRSFVFMSLDEYKERHQDFNPEIEVVQAPASSTNMFNRVTRRSPSLRWTSEEVGDIFKALQSRASENRLGKTNSLYQVLHEVLRKSSAPAQWPKLLAQLDAIGFKGSDHTNARQAHAAQERLHQALQLLEQGPSPLSAESKSAMLAFLRQNIRLGPITSPNGLRRAFLDVLSKLGKIPSSLEEVGFLKTDYAALSARDSRAAELRLMAAWNILAGQLQLTAGDFSPSAVEQVIASYRQKKGEAAPTRVRDESLTVPEIPMARLTRVNRGAREVFEKASVTPERLREMLLRWHGIFLEETDSEGKRRRWSVIYDRASDAEQSVGAFYSYGFVVEIRDQAVVQAWPADEEVERRFFNLAAQKQDLQATEVNIHLAAPDGFEIKGNLRIEGSVRLKIQLKHHIRLEPVNWDGLSVLSRTVRSGLQVLEVAISSRSRGSKYLMITANDANGLRLVSFYPAPAQI